MDIYDDLSMTSANQIYDVNVMSTWPYMDMYDDVGKSKYGYDRAQTVLDDVCFAIRKVLFVASVDYIFARWIPNNVGGECGKWCGKFGGT